MNLHVFTDTYGLFLNIAKEKIIKYNKENNLAVCLVKNISQRDDYIDYILLRKKAAQAYINSLPQIEKLVLHPLDFASGYFASLVLKKQPQVKIHWVFWSYEFYNVYFKKESFLENFSLKISKKLNKINNAKFFIKKIIKNIFSIPFRSSVEYFEITNKVTTIHSFSKEDYKLVIEKAKLKNVNHEQFSYLTITEIANINAEYPTKDDILVGHAASFESNQAEILLKLSELEYKGNIVLPLAYGDGIYKNEIKQLAKKIFDENVQFIETKMPMKAYYEYCGQFKYAIFNLKVQQGLGNILGFIYCGIKVFIRSDCSLFAQLKNWDLYVYDTLKITTSTLTSGLDELQIQHNRAIIEGLFNDNKVNQYWNKILN